MAMETAEIDVRQQERLKEELRGNTGDSWADGSMCVVRKGVCVTVSV